MRAWFTRARRLVADLPDCPEQGWVAVAALGCDVDDPAELLDSAELALDRARRFGDVNLETKALADAGLAHVQLGSIATGMGLLDEAMALACGPADDEDTAAKSVCSFFTACYHAADYGRALSWADLLRRRGLIAHERPGPVFVSSHCDSVQATLLMELGRWTEAERLLEQAIVDFESVLGIPSWHPAIALADLCVRQGRLADAETLLIGKDQSMEALLPAVRLSLARGDLELARAAARRGVQAMADDRLRSAELLTTLAHIELGRGDVPAARAAADEALDRLADSVVQPLIARARLARADVAARSCDLDAAIVGAAIAVDLGRQAGLAWIEVEALLAVARHRRTAGDTSGATVDARTAASVLAGLDVVLSPEQRSFLDEVVGRSASSPSSVEQTAVLVRDGRWWDVSFGQTSVRVADTKGLRYLAELVAAPGVERHALDLVDRIEGVDVDGIDRRRLGDAGEVLDGRARSAYRREIERLRGEIDTALASGSLDAAEAMQTELDAYVAELSAAFGLGGRARRAGSATEKARLNVTRALRAAIRSLNEALPAIGAVLDRGVRTGTYCVFEPADGDGDIGWIVQS
ncbi:MAG: tetratricopeptide repeat protein [Ilumatobacteraceae bacterium]